MRTITEVKTVYKFSELSESAQEKAIERESQSIGEYWDGRDMYDDFERIGNILGIEFRQRSIPLRNSKTRQEPTIWYSGFWSQGDGACFEGTYRYNKGASKAIRAYAGTDTELHRIADELAKLQRPYFYDLVATMTHSGHYYHEYCMRVDVELGQDQYSDRTLPEDDITSLMRDFARWIYKSLEAEYEYQTSRECCVQSIEANELEFTEDGELA